MKRESRKKLLSLICGTLGACAIVGAGIGIAITIENQNNNPIKTIYQADGSDWSNNVIGGWVKDVDYTLDEASHTASYIWDGSTPKSYTSTNTVIPGRVIYDGDEYDVVIETWAFSLDSGVVLNGSLTIAPGITTINEYAFYNGGGITSLNLASSVHAIQEDAFAGCYGLTSLNIPSSVTTIGECAFQKCIGLQSLNLSSYTGEIGGGAFELCDNLNVNNVILPSTGNYDNWKVLNTSNFKSIYISSPTYVSVCGNLAFGSITSANLSTMGFTNNIYNSAFIGCFGLTNVDLSSFSGIIDDYAFMGCYGLISLNLSGVTSIGKSAFDRCSVLDNLTITNNTTSIGNNAFTECVGLQSLNVTNFTGTIGVRAFDKCDHLSSLNFSGFPSSIGREAFIDCNSLIQITVILNIAPTNVDTTAFANINNINHGDFMVAGWWNFNGTDKQTWMTTHGFNYGISGEGKWS